MAFIRLSLMTPRPGQEQRVADLIDQLLDFYQGRPGFITAYRLTPDKHSGSPRVGRISVWESEGETHRTATEPRDMALQSELKLAVIDETHEEYSFQGTLAPRKS